MSNKYNARRTWSLLCGKYFASKKEAIRAEELTLLEKAGEISELEFQPKFVLCLKPKITYAADFRYLENGERIVEDVKGYAATRECRVKLAWIKEKYNIDVRIYI